MNLRGTPVRCKSGVAIAMTGGNVHYVREMESFVEGGRICYYAKWLCRNWGAPRVMILPADHGMAVCIHCEDRRHPAVYRCLADDDSPVYIGSTQKYTLRMQQHRLNSEWWPLVAEVRRENFPTYPEAYAAEQAAIRAELPLFNRGPQRHRREAS